LGLGFNAIYTGFLGSSAQLGYIRSFIRKQRLHANPLVLVDPVLGDGGKLYGPMQDTDVEAMRILACDADVITPNVTEAALLLGEPYQEQLDERTALEWARKLSLQTHAKVAITSVDLPSGKGIACFDASDEFLVPYQHLRASYPGCGDLFASLLLGFLLNKESFRTSIEASATYTSLAIERTLAQGYEHRHGVMPSLMFADLSRRMMSHVG
jgi:pyridoxine kinase